MQRNADITKRLDALSLLFLSMVVIGWFGMDTMVVSFGHLVQSTRFYEVGVAVLQPATLFVGVGSNHTVALTLFTLLALLTLFAAVAAPVMFAHRWAWLAGWAPLALMLACAGLLYFSGAATSPPPSGPGLHDDLVRIASHLLQHAQDAAVSHISIGAGGMLSALASTALAIRSTRMFRVEMPDVSFERAPFYAY
jgi:hypothetical protein